MWIFIPLFVLVLDFLGSHGSYVLAALLALCETGP